MKTVKFQGTDYEVPDWARWITQNKHGAITVWEAEPQWMDDAEIWYSKEGSIQSVANPGSPALKMMLP